MNEDQKKQIQQLVQDIADEGRISFDSAFKIVIGVLRLHTIDNAPKGEGRAGGPIQAL